MSVPIAALFLFFILGHSADSPSNRHNEKSVGFANDRTKALDCADPNGYTLVVARDMIRDANDVSIVQGNQVLKIMTLPGQSEVSGFTLNWAKKIKGGFEAAAVRVAFVDTLNFVAAKYLSNLASSECRSSGAKSLVLHFRPWSSKN